MNQKRLKILTSLAYPKYRQKHGLFLVEGEHSIKELLNSKWEVESLILTGELAESWKAKANRIIPKEIVTRKVFEKIAKTESPQGIMAVAKTFSADMAKIAAQRKILVADGIKDPGNLGTIIRTAAAFGFEALATTEGSVDIYNPKVVRATQGGLFKLIVVERVCPDLIIETTQKTHGIYVLSARGDTDIESLQIKNRCMLVVGGEIKGASVKFLKAADYLVRIPMAEDVDSLNAAVAAGIALYRFGLRQ